MTDGTTNTPAPRRTAPSALERPTLPRGWGVGLFALAVVAPLLRERGVPTWDNIWVEDGPVYARDVLQSGWSSAFRGYFGYLQGLDRLLALPVSVVPPGWWAAYFAVVSTVMWALAAAFVYRTSASWISSAACRLALCAVIVASPAAAWETNASISNTMWAALLVVPFAFLSERRGRVDTALRSIAVFLGILSSPLAVLFLPIGLVAAATRRRASEVVVLTAFGAGLAIQVAAWLSTGIEPGSASSWRLVADLYGLRVVGSSLVGELPLDTLWTEVGEPAVLVLVGSFVALWGVLFARSDRSVRLRAGLFLGLSVVVFVVPIVGRGIAAVGFDLGVYTLSYTRLTIVPILLLVTSVAMLVDPVGGHRRPSELWRAAFLAQTAAVVVLGFSVTSARGAEPGWTAARSRVLTEQCAGRPDDTVVTVPTTPSTFRFTLTCGQLRG
ncbi:MAG: hypothetical protein R2726_18935 [Acidimicrobiales bacterium]